MHANILHIQKNRKLGFQSLQGLFWKFGLMGFGPSTQISRGHKLARGMGATKAPIGVQGQCHGVGARGAKPKAENEFKHFWAQKMTPPGSCCCYLRLQFWGRISINCAAQGVNAFFAPILMQSAQNILFLHLSYCSQWCCWSHGYWKSRFSPCLSVVSGTNRRHCGRFLALPDPRYPKALMWCLAGPIRVCRMQNQLFSADCQLFLTI